MPPILPTPAQTGGDTNLGALQGFLDDSNNAVAVSESVFVKSDAYPK
jgi:hypothetical protein